MRSLVVSLLVSLLVSSLAIGACTGAKPAAPRTPATPAAPAVAKTGARVMVLGTYHFHNPGHDVVKAELDDHLRPERQAQIELVADKLAAFRPTRILVEAVDQAKLDEAYRRGDPLSSNEIEQLGFRLARRFGLPGVIAIDVRLGMDFDRLLAAANASGDRVFLDEFQEATKQVEREQAAFKHQTVLENLRFLNDPAYVARDRDFYLQLARVKRGDDFAGADVLAAWYQRNFRIFTNLAAAVTSPDDRVLVLYGAGHVALLRELIAASTNLVLVDPDGYLR